MRRRDFFGATILLPDVVFGSAQKRLQRVVLIGDSTVADYPVTRSPITGWGQVLRQRLRSYALVFDYAVPGSSTRWFAEHYWPRVRSKLLSGDLLLIQFGHVDALPDQSRHTEPYGAYQRFLLAFVKEARAVGARPILVTPVERYQFVHGHVIGSHGNYPDAMREVAQVNLVPLVDLTHASTQALERLGVNQARSWFMITYDGHDKVHLSPTGADAVAVLVEAALLQSGILSR